MSSTFGLTFTRNDLIKAVLRVLGVIGQTQDPTPEDYNFCSEALNIMIKSWVAKGATLWKINELVVPMVPGVHVYPLGPTAGYVYSIAVTNGGSGYTIAPVTITDSGSGTGATAIATIVGGVITAITVTLPGDSYTQATTTVDIGGDGVGATASIVIVGLTTDRPLRILDHSNYMRNNSTQLDITMMMIGQTDYNMLGNKTTSANIPNQFFYNPLLGNGLLSVYPAPANTGISYSAHLFAQIIYSDTDKPTTTFDFPQEFLNPLKWGLAYDLVPEYGVDDRTEKRINDRYAMYVTEGLDFSVEEADMRFTYNNRGH